MAKDKKTSKTDDVPPSSGEPAAETASTPPYDTGSPQPDHGGYYDYNDPRSEKSSDLDTATPEPEPFKGAVGKGDEFPIQDKGPKPTDAKSAPVYTRESLPSNPLTWDIYESRVLPNPAAQWRLLRHEGPFVVQIGGQRASILDGWLVVDPYGALSGLTVEEQEAQFVAVPA